MVSWVRPTRNNTTAVTTTAIENMMMPVASSIRKGRRTPFPDSYEALSRDSYGHINVNSSTSQEQKQGLEGGVIDVLVLKISHLVLLLGGIPVHKSQLCAVRVWNHDGLPIGWQVNSISDVVPSAVKKLAIRSLHSPAFKGLDLLFGGQVLAVRVVISRISEVH